MGMQFSKNQVDYFIALKDTNSSISLLATAGSGKTTTIIEGLRHIPRNCKAAFFSFSNSIVKELQERVPPHMKFNTMTLHSRGLRFIKKYLNRDIKIADGGNKYFGLALDMLRKELDQLGKKEFRTAYVVQDICAFVRQTLSDYSSKESVIEVCNYYNIEFEEGIIDMAMELLKKHAKDTKAKFIDFVDMVYWPAVMPEMVNETYDIVFLDEAQDTNKAQLQMIENMLREDSRLIAVGDDNQCIYGFSGADVDAFKRIRERPNTITLPLSVTYRCPKNVVKKVQELVPEIEAYEGSKEGEVREGHWTEIREGDMVLCRVTRPLVSCYFALIEKGVKAHVVGKDIEKGLISLAEKTMSQTHEGMMYNIEQERERKKAELEHLGVKYPMEHPQFISLEEKIQVLTLIMKKVDNLRLLMDKIREIFHEDKKAARLMTIHRSKGLENDRVFIIEKDGGVPLSPSKYAKQDWERRQEKNLIFVAQTRPKSELIFLSLTDI